MSDISRDNSHVWFGFLLFWGSGQIKDYIHTGLKFELDKIPLCIYYNTDVSRIPRKTAECLGLRNYLHFYVIYNFGLPQS